MGTKVLALPVAESYRLCCRVALAVLLEYFEGELGAERKAFALHYALARRISSVCGGWSLTRLHLDEIVADILCAAKGGNCQLEILSAERRDVIRQLCTSHN